MVRWSKRTVSSLAIMPALVLGVTQPASHAAEREPLAIAAIARYEAMSSVAISPDGKHVAALVATDKYKWPVVAIYDAADLAKPPVWIPSETLRVVQVSFFSNERVSFVAEAPILNEAGQPTFTRKLYFADLAGKKIVEASRPAGSRNQAARDNQERYGGIGMRTFALLDDPDKVLIERTGQSQAIVELNLKTQESRLLADAGERTYYMPGGVDTKTGEPRVRTRVEIEGERFFARTYIRDRDSGDWVRHDPLSYEMKDRRTITPSGFDTDPNTLFVIHNKDRNFAAVYSYDIKGQKFSAEPLYAIGNYDITALNTRRDAQSGKMEVMSLTVGGPASSQLIIDPKWVEINRRITAAFPGKSIHLQPNRSDRSSAIVTVEASNLPPEYYLFREGKLAPLGKQRPWIDSTMLGRTEFTTYPARDGLKIPAFVTYPPGWTKEQGPVPLVVLPHGGPWARDELGWDGTGWTQFLATRGVAVVQPQYRGSDGWGRELWFAGDGEWGQKMQDDKDDAAAWLVKQGLADPKRLAIFGYSYGGFAAIAASVRPNSPYRCAIAGAGVSSLDRIGNLWGGGPIQQEVQGRTVRGMDPIKNVEKANIPIMLYHGDHDRQADTEHSRIFYRAMKSAGKQVEYHEIKGMWHTLPWHKEWHEQTLGLIENYLASDHCNILPKK